VAEEAEQKAAELSREAEMKDSQAAIADALAAFFDDGGGEGDDDEDGWDNNEGGNPDEDHGDDWF